MGRPDEALMCYDRAIAKNTLSSLGKTLNAVDKISTQIQQTKDEIDEPKVKSIQEENKLSIERGDEELVTITTQNLGTLTPEQRQLINSYEESMGRYFDIYTEVGPQLALETDPIKKSTNEIKLKGILKDMCSKWRDLTDLLKTFGIDLTGKYREFEYLCKEGSNIVCKYRSNTGSGIQMLQLLT